MTKIFLLSLLACCHVQRAVVAIKTRLTWVNGIAYNLQHMEEGKIEIKKLFNTDVDICYNPTAMANEEDTLGYVTDLAQAGSHKAIGLITDEVNDLVKHLRNAVQQVGKRGKVLHIAHSQGALITSLASKQLTRDEMAQIEVLAFGGAVAIRKTSETPFARVVNYYSLNDPLLFIVPSAKENLHSGMMNDEFCFLSPKEGDPVSDHNLIGRTYIEALQWEGLRYQNEYQSLLYRLLLRPVSSQIVYMMQSLVLSLLVVWNRLYYSIILRYVIAPVLAVIKLLAMLIKDVIMILWAATLRGENDEIYIPLDEEGKKRLDETLKQG